MSSTSRPHTTGTSSNIPPGQSPSKSSVESTTNQLAPQNVAQPLYQNNPNQQFIPNNIPLINPAQQLQFQSQLSNLNTLQQTAAFLQRQQILQYQQQQQQQQQQTVNSVTSNIESQLKNQQLSNGPLASFSNFPDLFNLFQLIQSNTNSQLPQLLQSPPIPPSQPQQQQQLQVNQTIPITSAKLNTTNQSQHIPRTLISSPQSVTIAANSNNVQTAEVKSCTSSNVIPPVIPTEIPVGSSKLLLTPPTTVPTVSSSIAGRLPSLEVKEQSNLDNTGQLFTPAAKKNYQEDTMPSNSTSSHNNVAQESGAVAESKKSPTVSESNKSPLPRRKQTSATNISPVKSNPIISTTIPCGSTNDSMTFSTPKKSIVAVTDVSPSTPPNSTCSISSSSTSAEKKNKQSNKDVNVQKMVKKDDTGTKDDDPKPLPTSPESPIPITEENSIEDLAVIDAKLKRHRFKTTLYQSPTPDFVLATKMSFTESQKRSIDFNNKLRLFYKDEFLAVRNDEGSFYLCQCLYNVYKSSKKCAVKWLNKLETSDDIYSSSFHDKVDMECILTSVVLESVDKKNYKLTKNERERIENILKKSIDVEKGVLPRPEVTEKHPDGLDISLYTNESQLEVKPTEETHVKRKLDNSSKSTITPKRAKIDTKSSKRDAKRRKKTYINDESSDKALNGTSSRSSKKKTLSPQSRRSPRSSISTDSKEPPSKQKKSKESSKNSKIAAKSKTATRMSDALRNTSIPSERKLRMRHSK